jgi:hypothetical protein
MDMDRLWNVRGVGEEARRKAKSHAARAGMTIGEWLTKAIEFTANCQDREGKWAAETIGIVEVRDGEADEAGEGTGDADGVRGVGGEGGD